MTDTRTKSPRRLKVAEDFMAVAQVVQEHGITSTGRVAKAMEGRMCRRTVQRYMHCLTHVGIAEEVKMDGQKAVKWLGWPMRSSGGIEFRNCSAGMRSMPIDHLPGAGEE